MNTPDYRTQFYAKYVTAFKQHTLGGPDVAQAYAKLAPLIRDWVETIDRSAPVADLGCGDGRLLGVLQRLGFTSLAGCDLSGEQVELARRSGINVVCSPLVEFLESQPAEHFALLTLFDVIEHLTKAEILHLLGLMHSRLRPGGRLIVHAPNGDSPFASSVFSADFTHETLLNPMSAEALARLFGYVEFEAREHLGASPTARGRIRVAAWSLARLGVKMFNAVETGSSGSGIYTRNFAFCMRRAE